MQKLYPAKRFYESVFSISTPEIFRNFGKNRSNFKFGAKKKKMVLKDLTSNLVAWKFQVGTYLTL